MLEAVLPKHLTFNGVALDASNQVDITGKKVDNIRTMDIIDVGKGARIAKVVSKNVVLIAEWEADVAF